MNPLFVKIKPMAMKNTIIQIPLLIAFILCSLFTKAQDGESLFKAKCNTCHLLDKNSTGPVLKGVQAKWEEAGESDLLIQWIQNSPELIASGKSKMANAVKDFSTMEMPIQAVSPEEIKAILDFTGAYTPPAEVVMATPNSPKEVKYVPNYSENLTLFNWLIACFIVLLITIFILSRSIKNLMNSAAYKHKQDEKFPDTNLPKSGFLALLILASLCYSPSSLALSMTEVGSNTENLPWLRVENSDLYFLVVLNLILVGVVFYLKNLFISFARMIIPQAAPLPSKRKIRRLNKILVDSVPIEEESEILLKHEYDGIRELDNNLPPWWVWGFVATIIFAFIYMINFHVIKTGDLQEVAYEKEMEKAEQEVQAYREKMAMNVDETNVTLLEDEANLNQGKSIYDANCVACHNPNGEGNIGPNLTDKTWIIGYDIKDVFGTIKNGTANGMPEHNSKLNPVQIQQVASFILSLPETAGKAAEGRIVEK
jgi:cytochrome c oxidase cbb3-type subunit III